MFACPAVPPGLSSVASHAPAPRWRGPFHLPRCSASQQAWWVVARCCVTYKGPVLPPQQVRSRHEGALGRPCTAASSAERQAALSAAAAAAASEDAAQLGGTRPPHSWAPDSPQRPVTRPSSPQLRRAGARQAARERQRQPGGLANGASLPLAYLPAWYGAISKQSDNNAERSEARPLSACMAAAAAAALSAGTVVKGGLALAHEAFGPLPCLWSPPLPLHIRSRRLQPCSQWPELCGARGACKPLPCSPC